MKRATLILAALLGLVGAANGNATTVAAGSSHRPVCDPVPTGELRCLTRVQLNQQGSPAVSTRPAGYGPAEFHQGYGLPASAKAPQTIAIIDAYDAPTIEQDLAKYSSTYQLPACTSQNGCFRKVNQRGVASTYPARNAGWALETSMDVEVAHALCENCSLLLVEADSANTGNLATAVNTAVKLGATVISNSYGGSEISNSSIVAAYNHPGVAITASAGDSGYGVSFPASLPTVVAVGGTSLTVSKAANGRYRYDGEAVWSGTGSGCSASFSAQSWQRAATGWGATSCSARRGMADVAADADPATGAAVYDSTPYSGQSGWYVLGGTSLSSPLIAAVFALADNANSTAYPASLLYAKPSGLHDITTGKNGNCATTMCHGTSGYDGPTGLGSPKGLSSF